MANTIKVIFEYGGAPLVVAIAVWTFIWKMSPVIEKYLGKHLAGLGNLDKKISDVDVKVNKLIESDERQEKRLTVLEIEQSKKNLYSNVMPYTERVWSAHRYIRLGGNGSTREYIKNKLRTENQVEFDYIWKLADNAAGVVVL